MRQTLSYNSESAELVRDLQGDENDGTDGGINSQKD